jgi:hypothetical protein
MEYVGIGGKEFLQDLSLLSDYKFMSISEINNFSNPNKKNYASALHIIYGLGQNSVGIAVTLLEQESQLKNQPRTIYNSLSIFKSVDGVINEAVLDELVSRIHPGLPNLSLLTTANYLIVDGTDAIKMYNGIKSNPPESLDEFVGLLRHSNPSYRVNKKSINSKIPDPNMRSRLGRGI